MGDDSLTGRPVMIRSGRFGRYVQIGLDAEKNKTTHSLPQVWRAVGSNEISTKTTTITIANFIFTFYWYFIFFVLCCAVLCCVVLCCVVFYFILFYFIFYYMILHHAYSSNLILFFLIILFIWFPPPPVAAGFCSFRRCSWVRPVAKVRSRKS